MVNVLLPLLLFITFHWCNASEGILSPAEKKEFIESFVDRYEFNPEGRYTHEYHPFVLQWTAKSLDTLDDRLRSEGFSLDGRFVIMGYEEQAVPQYYTNFRKSKINDEATRKNLSGWSLRLHNRFGFMTGFLFKDLAKIVGLQKKCGQQVFQHLDAHTIPIFDDRAALFHEHAFGQALPLIRQEQSKIIKKLLQDDSKGVLCEMEYFWSTLYSHGFKVGNSQIAGTQDVLFSIEYAKHMIRSPLPLFNFFIGPDLTYPIEITHKQDKLATEHAQGFVSYLAKKLEPLNNKNTVYVFCSFVDGVGKSTMLGNIKNWMDFGDDIEKYQHVDNSSSQLATLFEFKNKVFIADLPAQISHFTYKPDGYVFADIRSQFDMSTVQELHDFVQKNSALVQNQGNAIFQHVKDIIAQQGFGAPELNDQKNPAFAFAKNIILLKKEHTNQWVPFVHNNSTYLVNYSKPAEIRFLTTLGAVKSEGLKNIESDQMLFFDGIRMPLPYKDFLDDLVAQLKNQDIEHVVFVDFLSMYPRSSRENIRINYLLQQMALLENDFNPHFSLYRDFISGGELLYGLMHKRGAEKIHEAFQLETVLRLALFDMVISRQSGDLTGVNLLDLTELVKHDCADVFDDYGTYITERVAKKIDLEKQGLEKIYGLSKSFINIQQFSFQRAFAFSSALQEIFAYQIQHETTNELWTDVGTIVPQKPLASDGQRLQVLLNTDQGITVKGLFAFHPECKNELFLAPCLKSLRANWYASILNLLSVSGSSEELWVIEDPALLVVPLMLAPSIDGYVYVVQPALEVWNNKIPTFFKTFYRPFNFITHKTTNYAAIKRIPYRIDWESKMTNSGLMGFDCDLVKEKERSSFFDTSTVSSIVQKHHNQHGANMAMTAKALWQTIKEDRFWRYEQEDQQKSAKKNGSYKGPSARYPHDKSKKPKAPFDNNQKVHFGTSAYKSLAQIVIRLLATLEMIIKDPDADIVVRDGNREDFKAAIKLFEHVILPTHCGLVFFDDLFDDYDVVQPYPSWDYWDDLAE